MGKRMKVIQSFPLDNTILIIDTVTNNRMMYKDWQERQLKAGRQPIIPDIYYGVDLLNHVLWNDTECKLEIFDSIDEFTDYTREVNNDG